MAKVKSLQSSEESKAKKAARELRFGNKRLTYARMKGSTHVEVIDVNEEKELERVRVLTCWKRL